MGGGGKCGKQETSWEGGSRADLGTGSGGMTKTEEGQVGTTGHNGSPGETELSTSADGLDVGYDGWRNQGQPVRLMVGAPPRSPVLPGYPSPSSSEGQPPPFVGTPP